MLSEDGGTTWKPVKGGEGAGILRGLAVRDAQVAVAVGDRGQIFRTHDGGRNWQAIARKGDENLLAAACNSDGLLLAVGKKGAVIISRDTGKTWARAQAD